VLGQAQVGKHAIPLPILPPTSKEVQRARDNGHGKKGQADGVARDVLWCVSGEESIDCDDTCILGQ